MKTLLLRFLVVLTALCPGLAQAADVQNYFLAKGQRYEQTNALSPLLSAGSAFRFSSGVETVQSNLLGAAFLVVPGGATLILTNHDHHFEHEQGFVDQTALDSALSAGDYTFLLVSTNGITNSATLTLAADSYPVAPSVVNWEALQQIDASQGTSIQWDLFVNGTTNDTIVVELWDEQGNRVLGTPGPVEPGNLGGTNVAMVIDGGVLAPGKLYKARLVFIKLVAVNTNSVPGAIGVAGYFRETVFPLMTVAPPPAPLEYFLAKGRQYEQTNATGPQAITGVPFRFMSGVEPGGSNVVVGASLTPPGGSTLVLSNRDSSFQYEAEFPDQTTLDAAFSAGGYMFSMVGTNGVTNTASLTLPPDNGSYPGAPRVANWEDLQAIDPAQGFAVVWDIFANGTTNDTIVLEIWDEQAGQLVGTPGPVQPGSLGGTNVSFGVRGGILAPNKTYQGRLMFVKLATVDTNTLPNAIGLVGYYGETAFPLRTLGSGDSGGSGGADLIQFGTGAQSVGENVPSAFVTVARTGTNGPVSVSLFSSNGTATGGDDYGPISISLVFGPGVQSTNVPIVVFDDSAPEQNETVILHLANPTGGAALGNATNLVLTIVDDDSGNGGNGGNGGTGGNGGGEQGGNDYAMFHVAKGQQYEQTNTSGPLLLSGPAYEFSASVEPGVSNGLSLVEILIPSGSTKTLTNEGHSFFLEERFESLNGLDLAYGVGEYTLSLIGTNLTTNQVSLVLPTDEDPYPSAPRVANWQALQEVNASQSVTVTWDAIESVRTNDFIMLEVRSEQGDGSLSTPPPMAPGSLSGTNLQVELPPGALASGKVYEARLMFVRIFDVDTNSVPGSLGLVGYYRQTRFAITTTSGGAGGNSSSGPSFFVSKGQHYQQTNAAPPTLLSASLPFRFFSAVDPGSSNVLGNATLKLPSGVSKTFSNANSQLEVGQGFSSKSLLDGSYGSGAYTFTFFLLNGATNRSVLNLGADTYPPVPHLINWPDLQEIESEQPFVMAWLPFTNGTPADMIVADVFNEQGDYITSTDELFERGTLTGTNLSITIPSGILTTNTRYHARLMFVKRTAIDTNALPGGVGMSGYYRETVFPLATLPAAPQAGRVQFSSVAFLAPENDATATITILRNGTNGTITVDLLTEDGSATEGLDYEPINTTLIFQPGVAETNIFVTLMDDPLKEGDELLFLRLSNPTGGAILGTRTNALLSLFDNELEGAGTLQFNPVNYSSPESSPSVRLTVSRSGGSLGTVSVGYHLEEESAGAGSDYVSTNGTLVFGPGQLSGFITVPLINDPFDETNKTFRVLLSGTSGGAALGSNTTSIVTVLDDDSGGALEFRTTTFTNLENTAVALISVLRKTGLADGVSVDFTTVNGTATSGNDFVSTNGTLTFGSNEVVKSFEVTILNDSSAEGNEELSLLLSNPTGGASLGTLSNATLRILDDESSVSFARTGYTTNEAGPAVVIEVQRSGALITAVAVDFATTNGTALSTNDYRGTNGTLAFAVGVAARTITIPIANDTLDEQDETFEVNLFNPQSGVQLGTITNTVVTLVDNDIGGVIALSTNRVAGPETGLLSVILKRTGGVASGVTVSLTTEDGTAIAGEDYTNATQTVTFGAGELTKTVVVGLINDCEVETNETVTVTLSNPTGGAQLGEVTEGTLVISSEDKGGVIALTSLTYATNENANGFLVTVARTDGVGCQACVDYLTGDGTAVSNLDYTLTGGTLCFDANELKKTILVPLENDSLAEGAESFAIALSNPAGGASLGTLSNATLRILDDESSVSFARTGYTTNEAGPAVVIEVQRSGALITAVAVDFATTNGTALSTNDYRGTNGTLAFAVGVAARTITIPIANDTLDEQDETFEVNLFNPQSGVQLGTITNTMVTIVDNDIGGVIALSTNRVAGPETGLLSVILKRTGGVASGVTVSLTTEDGTAIAGEDYTNATQTVTFGAGELTKTVVVGLINDCEVETNETVTVTLSNPTGGAQLGEVTEGTLVISSEDKGGVIALTSLTYATNENANGFLVTVARTDGVGCQACVDYLTGDGTAVSNLDYTLTGGTLCFDANELKKTILVPLENDSLAEGAESFAIALSNPAGGASLGTLSNATLRILDDESSVSFARTGYTTNEAGPAVVIEVQRSGALITAVAVDFATTNGTALSTNDYRGTNGTLAFAVGVAARTITIPIANDTLDEQDETFEVNLFNPQSGVQLGTITNTMVTIVDNDIGGVIALSTNRVAGPETGLLSVILKRTGGVASGVTVSLTTEDGTAIAGEDYTNATQTVTFGAGELTKTVVVGLINDCEVETNETVTVTLSNPTGGAQLGEVTEGTLVISSEDKGGVIALTSLTYATNENANGFLVTVARTDGVGCQACVDYLTGDGTAVSNLDYTLTGGTLCFDANELKKTILVPLENDSLAEGAESFAIALSNPAGGASLGTLSNATLRILDDESSVSFARTGYTTNEAGPAVVIEVQRSGALITAVAVDFATTNGTALSTNDYRGTNGTLAFAVGVAARTITIPIANDTLDEQDETFEVNLFNPQSGVQLGTITNTVVTIVDNDIGGVIALSTNRVAGPETGLLSVILKRTGGVASGVTVSLTTEDGTAIAGEDYTNATQTVTFGAGELTKTVVVGLINDCEVETNETVTVTLSNPTGGAQLGEVTEGTLVISSEDKGGVIALTSLTYATNENANGFLVTVARTDGVGCQACVDYLTGDGTAVSNLDYTLTGGTLCFDANELKKTILVPLANDSLAEGAESFGIALSNPAGGASLGTLSNATLRILDDESSVSFARTGYTTNEAGPAVVIEVQRSGALITAVAVDFATTNGTALSTNDYRGTNGTLAFAVGVAARTITIPIANDTLDEQDETFEVNLFNPQSGVQLGTITNTMVTIVDNDIGGVIALSTNRVAGPETGLLSVILKRTGGVASGVTVSLTTEDGTAIAGEDYTNATQTVTFGAGELTKTVVVGLINDCEVETNETVTVTLSNPTGGAQLGEVTEGTLVISSEDKGGVIALTSLTYATNENANGFLVTVARTDGVGCQACVDYLTGDGTAVSNLDYTLTGGTLCFDANELKKTILVPLENDSLAEGAESFAIALSNPAGGASLGTLSNATLRILDDESSVSFARTGYTTNEAGPAVVIEVQRSGALITAVAVDFATTNGTALSTNDYRGTNGTLAFAVGVAARTITIPIANDTLDEQDETFEVNLFNPQSGVQLGTITNTVVTIVDNDAGGTIKLSAATYSGTEGTNAIIKVFRSGGLASGVTVQLESSAGTATAGTDYTEVSTNLVFAAGETNKTVNLAIAMDALVDSSETVNLTLTEATGGASLGEPNTAVLTLTDKPDPNAIPASGPVFLKYTMGSTLVNVPTNMLQGAGYDPGSEDGTVAPTFSFGGSLIASTTSSVDMKQLIFTRVVVRSLGPVTLSGSSSNGVVDLSHTHGSLFSPIADGYASYNGTASGPGGTFILDTLDTVNKVASGRFDFILRNTEDTESTNPHRDVRILGSFRFRWL